MKKIFIIVISFLLFYSLVFSQAKLGGTAKIGGTAKVGKAATGGGGSGRAIILNGTSQYGTTTTSAGMSNSVSGWRFMARIRGANLNPGATKYMFRSVSGQPLTITISGNAVSSFIGPSGDAAGNIFPTGSTDFILLIRANPAGNEVSAESWDLSCGNRQGSQNTSASGSATNFQSQDLVFGAFSGAGDFFTGKIDRAGFKSGAGSYNGTCPNLTTETLDLIDWTFDADNGTDANGNASLTLFGTPSFEDTP